MRIDETTLAELCRRLNASEAFKQAVPKAGAFLFRAGELSVFLRIEPGRCAEARLGGTPEEADFVIEASPEAWEKLVRGELDVVAAFTRGQLKLTKGNLFALMPYARAAKAIFGAFRA